MTLAAIAFAAGAAALQLQAELPSIDVAVGACTAGHRSIQKQVLLRSSGVRRRFLLGRGHGPPAHGRLAGARARRPRPRRGRRGFQPARGQRARGALRVRGRIRRAALAEEAAAGVASQPVDSEEGPALLREPVHPGERWLFTVRLRRPHGHVNPLRLRLRSLASRARRRGDRVCQAAGRAAQSSGRETIFMDSGGKSPGSGARSLPGAARRDAGRRDPRRAGGRRPARDLRRGMAALQPHRRDAPDVASRDCTSRSSRVSRRGWWRSAGGGCRPRQCVCPRARQRPRRRSPRPSATRCSPGSRCRRSAPSTW